MSRLSSYFFPTGAVHEHTRPDRDLYVKILWENIQAGTENNFEKVSNDTHSTSNTPFDYKSIMIYGPYDFGIEGSSGEKRRTIQPLETGIDMRYISILRYKHIRMSFTDFNTFFVFAIIILSVTWLLFIDINTVF